MKINIFCPAGEIHHTTACLIQGLVEIGDHDVAINLNPLTVQSNGIYKPFFMEKGFPAALTASNNFSKGLLVVDISNGIGQYKEKLINCAKNTPVVLINMHDSSNWEDYEDEFLVFSAHFNKNAQRKGRIYPLGFGLSNEAIKLASPSFNKKNIFLRNFRPSMHQSVRNALDLILMPKIKDIGDISQENTTQEEYIEKLKTYRIVLAYCGEFYKDLRQNPYFLKEENSRINFKKIIDDPIILRFDSWRFYEAALFEAVPLTVSLEKYGLDTGGNPAPWEEYIPLEFDKIDETVEQIKFYLKNDIERITKIGKAARKWVIREHSPLAIAKRFLKICQKEGMLS